MSTATTPARPVLPPRPAVPGMVAAPVAAPAFVPPVAPVAAPAAPVAAPAAPVMPSAVESAAPVTTAAAVAGAPKARKKRTPKPGAVGVVDYPGLFDVGADGQPVAIADAAGNVTGYKQHKLTEVPADYNSKIHNKLKVDQFATESLYWSFRAAEATKLATVYAKKSETLAKVGTGDNQKNATKLLKMMKTMAALQAQLAAAGIDVSSLEAE